MVKNISREVLVVFYKSYLEWCCHTDVQNDHELQIIPEGFEISLEIYQQFALVDYRHWIYAVCLKPLIFFFFLELLEGILHVQIWILDPKNL